VAHFDDELKRRHQMRPGITGLWQVEARDNPSFNAYRRLDLSYVDDWSLTLDIAILASTAHEPAVRVLKELLHLFGLGRKRRKVHCSPRSRHKPAPPMQSALKAQSPLRLIERASADEKSTDQLRGIERPARSSSTESPQMRHQSARGVA
jgi:hypothetical protein